MKRPNLLWIVTTQWRAQACGYAGDVNARTPALDALAAQSIDFAQAVTPHPFGPFARAALLTGVLSPENGVRDYFDPLPTDRRTIAHEMGDLGYTTAFFGKWHLGRRERGAPLVGDAHAKTIVPSEARGGFGFWEGFESGFLLNDPWLHGTALPEPTQFPGYQTDVVCIRAATWIERQRAPWFAVVSLEAPHPPYDAPAAGVAPRAPGEIVLPPSVPRGGEVEAKARCELAGYYAHIQATDTAIGRLLEGLSEAETAVVFTSVHGDMHGSHGRFRKGWPHEESVRVPLLVRWPGETPRREDAAVSLVDLPGLAMAGVREVSIDVSAVARRGFAAISMPSVVALPEQCDRPWRGVRTATRKLVLNEDGSPWLFFDLSRDPGEMVNLIDRAEYTDECAALLQWVAR